MENAQSSVKSGFTYHVEHLRSVALMRELGLSIEGLERRGDLVLLSIEDITNLIPTEGLNYMLGAALTGVAQTSSWFISLFEGNYTPVAGVTAATYPADATESTAYTEATRVAWVPGAISAGSVSNTASKAVFTINATKTMYGIAQTSVSAKSATTGTLVSVARFSAAKSVVATDVLNVTSTISATST
jgi:hypothetical protein